MNQPSEGMSKRERRRERRRHAQQRSRMWTILGVVVVAGILAFLLIWPNLRPVGEIIVPDTVERPQVQANATGDPSAPITIVEYGDFQCPFCRTFYKETEAELVEEYVATGKVRFVYRSFGEFIGPESRASAEAAYCAGDQGKFWEMHDIIFENQTGENVGAFSNRRLVAFAETLGLDMDEFRTCFNGGTYASRVEQDFLDGRAAAIQATPSFVLTYVVNGETRTRLLQGAQPLSQFQVEIDAALAEMGVE